MDVRKQCASLLASLKSPEPFALAGVISAAGTGSETVS